MTMALWSIMGPWLIYMVPALILGLAVWLTSVFPMARRFIWVKLSIPLPVILSIIAFLYFGWQSVLVQTAKGAIGDYVHSAELTAANAQLVEEKRRRMAAQDAERVARERAAAAEQQSAIDRAELEAVIAKDDGADGATWTDGDLRWLQEN